jgi:Zn-dependent protease
MMLVRYKQFAARGAPERILSMLMSEPPPSQGDVSFSIAGIPVRIHPMFWLFTLLPVLNDRPFDALRAGLWLLAVLISILIHELGHAFTARWFGARPWITLYALGGLASYRPQELSPRIDPTLRSVLISFAGPGAGFLLAGIVIAGLESTGYQYQVAGMRVDLDERLANMSPYLYFFISNLLFINIMWGIINLVPVYPLDGGQILRAILERLMGTQGIMQTLMTAIILGGGIAAYAMFQMQNAFLGVLFAYIAFQNYQIYEHLRHQRW